MTPSPSTSTRSPPTSSHRRAQQLASRLAGPPACGAVAVGDQADENLFEYADDVAWVSPTCSRSFVAALDDSARAALEHGRQAARAGREAAEPSSRARCSPRSPMRSPTAIPSCCSSCSPRRPTSPPRARPTLVGSLQAIIDDTDGAVAGLARALDEGCRRPSAATCAPRSTAIDDGLDALPAGSTSSSPIWRTTTIPPRRRASFCALVAGTLAARLARPAADRPPRDRLAGHDPRDRPGHDRDHLPRLRRRGQDPRPRLQRVPPAFPAPGLGRARRRTRSGR